MSAATAIEEAFWQFHDENPHVYDRLVRLTRELQQAGHQKIGMKMLFEVMRWQGMLETHGDGDGFKLNNNYHALYARLLMAENDEFDGIFEIRRLHNAEEPFGQITGGPVGHVAPPSFLGPAPWPSAPIHDDSIDDYYQPF